jgi:hypothetical protein
MMAGLPLADSAQIDTIECEISAPFTMGEEDDGDRIAEEEGRVQGRA